MRARLFLILGFLLLAGEVHAVDKALLRWVRNEPPIDSILIEGNRYFESNVIRKHLYSRPRTIWLAIKGDRRSGVHRETLQRDTLEVKYLYLTNGFLNVRVEHDFVPLRELTMQDTLPPAMVHIRIDEGIQYRYGARGIAGTYSPEFHHAMNTQVQRLREGDPLNFFDLTATKTTLKTYLANRGYPFARIDFVVDTTGAPESCRVIFEIEADSLVHFGDVRVEIANPTDAGNSRYGTGAALRELKIVPGKIYRREDLLESQRRLFESGYYTTFTLDTWQGSRERLRPEFLLRVTERKAQYFAFRVGAAQSDVRDLQWDVSSGIGWRNFMTTRTLDLSGSLSFSAGKDTRLLDNALKLKFIEPWLFGKRTKGTLTGEIRFRIKDPVKDFEKESRSVSWALSKWFGRRIRTSIGLEYQYVKLSGIPEDEIPIIKEQEGISARRKLYFTIRRDSRTDPFIPDRGSLTEFNANFYGGFLRGDADFYKLQGAWSRYRRVWPGWIYATRIRGGWATAFGQTATVPVDEALYLGGANTVRGFRENMLGPLDAQGDPVGARYTVVFNQEFRWKTIQFLNVLPFVGDLFARFPQWQSLFVDIGNGFANKEEMRFDKLAVAYGTGLQITSPAGPIRIDRAWVLEHHDFDYNHRWHFTILYAF
jgi:outer membrane protein assembly complex protein YaeT